MSYISSNSSPPEAITVAFSLLKLMNKHIDPNMSWLPTANGLSSKQRINSGLRDTDLFDKVLVTLGESISISPSFKELSDWDRLFKKSLHRYWSPINMNTLFRSEADSVTIVAAEVWAQTKILQLRII
ncbi:hypothetical protein JOM56_005171 [Amanita muscaria]